MAVAWAGCTKALSLWNARLSQGFAYCEAALHAVRYVICAEA
jgi:hypothetical protein